MITVIRLRGTLKIVIKLEEFIINSFEKQLHIKNASLVIKRPSPKFKLPANGDEMKDDASLVVKNMAELTKVLLYLQQCITQEKGFETGDTTEKR